MPLIVYGSHGTLVDDMTPFNLVNGTGVFEARTRHQFTRLACPPARLERHMGAWNSGLWRV